MNERQTPYWAFRGGLDIVTPALEVPPGRLIAGRNFEPWINGGYRRVDGYERYDGRPRPSDATWITLNLTAALDASVDAGNTLSGQTSGATGYIIEISDDRLQVHLTQVVGTFQAAETLDDDTQPLTDVGVTSGGPLLEYADDVDHEASLRLAAEAVYRTAIQQVPGINAVRGVWQIEDRVYAFRDNIGETACVMHKATASGWDDSAIEMAHYVYFTTGTVEPSVGNTLVGASSAASGTIHKIVVHTGDWSTNDAAGYFVLTSVTGTYTDTENLQVSAVTQATASGNSAQFAFPVGGRYVFESFNFYANSSTKRVYGANGVGPAFEIDENDIVSPVLLDLTLGDAPDENEPFLVACWDGRLWLGFPGGSVQHSIVGEPLVWNGFLGAAEYGLGDELTAITAVAGNVLAVRTRKQTHGFYKADAGGYQKRIISDRAGGILYSEGELDQSYILDDSGLTNLARVERFGDFGSATISDLVQPYLASRKELVAGVMLVREANQYRVLYTNGEGMIARILADGTAEFGILLYPTTIHAAYSCENENGTPTTWFCGGSGYVYQQGLGRNFDGEDIEASARLPFNHLGDPGRNKRYHLLLLELTGDRAIELLLASDLNYADADNGAYSWSDRVVGGGGLYDVDNWDRIYWDAQQFNTARFELIGSGKNISFLFHSTSKTTRPFILQGAHLHFTPRSVRR